MLHTKNDYQQCLKRLVMPLEKYFTSGKAGIKCGATGAVHAEKVAQLEAFARPLWGLGPLWAGGGECGNFDKIYLEGIINGTNPEHEEYWGEIGDFDQRTVEAAAMALSLILAPQKIWEPLSEIEKSNFYNWLSKVNKVKTGQSNWLFFAVLVNLGFRTIKMPYDKNIFDNAIAKFEGFYKGNGWYSDGDNARMDYYTAFAIHFYSLIYAKVMEHDDPENSKKFKSRAERFAKDFIYWFDEDGSSIAFGRSLTYRFAQCCFWGACVFAGARPFPMGVIKGIISRHLEYWMKLPIFDNAGILTVGYGYPNIGMSEDYNAFGSPYWALKSFIILALDDNDEFFETDEMPLPKLDKLHVIPEAKMVIQRINGYVVALTSGQWIEGPLTHAPEKYSKFAYSSRFAFSVPRSYLHLQNAGCDSMLVFLKDDMCFVRKECKSHSINPDGSITSEWSPCEGVNVETKLIPTDDGHIRVHKITCDKDIIAYDCAFATPDNSGEVVGNGEIVTVACTANTNLIHTNTLMKTVKYTLKKGTCEITTSVVYPK